MSPVRPVCYSFATSGHAPMLKVRLESMHAHSGQGTWVDKNAHPSSQPSHRADYRSIFQQFDWMGWSAFGGPAAPFFHKVVVWQGNCLLCAEDASHLQHICSATGAGDSSVAMLGHMSPSCRSQYTGPCGDVD